MFELNGNSFSLEDIKNMADSQGYDFDTYMSFLKDQGLVEKPTTPQIVDAPAESSVTASKPEDILSESQEKTSGLKTSLSSFGLGFLEFGRGLSSINEGIQLGLTELFTPGEMTAEEKKVELAKIRARAFVGGATPPSIVYDPAIRKLEENIPEYETKSITEDIQKGNYAQAAKRTIDGALRSAPSLVAAATGVGGLIALGTSAAGNKFEEEFEANPEKNTGKLLANAAATGGAEATFELATRGLLKRAGFLNQQGNAEAARKLLEGGAKNIVKNLGIGLVGEGASEASTELTIALIDAIPEQYGGLGKKIDANNLIYRLGDAAIIGSFVGGGISTVGEVANRSSAAKERAEAILTPDEINAKINERAKNINKLVEDLPQATEEGKALINEKIEQERLGIINLRKESSELLSNLEGEDLQAYAQNIDKINKAKDLARKANTESEKQIAIEEYRDITQANNDILKNSAKKVLDKNIANVEKISKQVYGDDVEIKRLTSEQVKTFVEDNPNLSKETKKSIAEEAALSQGFFQAEDVDGRQFVVINEDVATKTYATNVAGHEFLHKVLNQTFKSNPKTQVKVGKALINKLAEMDLEQVTNSKFARRLAEYSSAPENVQAEEILTVLSDSIATGDLQFNNNIFTKIGDVIRQALQNIGLKSVKFNTGKDVYNFVKDYNKSIEKGRLRGAIKKAAVEGITGELVTQPIQQVTEDVTKFSRDVASQEVQSIYEQKGEAGVFDIFEKFKPITTRIARRFREVPGYDEQLIIDEIETGDRGILDLIRAYKPESGVPLAAYINKFLPARSIEAGNRVLKTQFEEDVAEAKGVVAEETVEQKPERKTKLKVLADQLNIADKVKSEVAEADIDPDVLTNFKSVPNAAINTIGELLGISPAKIKSKANLTAAEVASAQRWFNKNARAVIDALPQGFDVEGKATGVPKTVLEALYTKREARAKTKAGLRTQVKRPNIKDSELLRLVDIIDGKPTRNRNTSARVIALADLLGKVITNQELRKSNPSLQRIRSGMADIMFSKGVNQNEEFETQATFLVGEIIDNGYESVIEDGKLAIGYEASPSVVSFIKSIYEDGTIVEAEDVKFKQSIFKSNLIPKEVKEAYKTVGNLRYNKEALDLLHKDASVVAETLGPEIMNAIGYEVLGYKNRVMDPAAKKKDTGQPGDYYKKLESLKDKVNNKKIDLPKGLVIEDVNIMNIGVSSSVFKDVIKVLNKDISRPEKLTQLEKLAPKINNASVANLTLAKHIAKTIINLTRAGRISTISAFNILQSQTSIVQGFRGLSGLDLITVADGSQKPSKNHPHYKRAVKYFKDSDKALQKMGYKGEHLGPNSNTMFKIAELIYDENADIDLSLNKAFRGHSQMLTSKYLTDVMDDKGGKNNDTDFKRVKFLDKVDIQESTSADGKSYEQVLAENEISKKLDELILQPTEIKKRFTLSKNISNVRPVLQYSKQSRGMSTFDFDETLIIDGENFVTATKGGETVKIPSDKWPIDGPKYAAEGWKFDFSDFVNVRGGKEGPLLQKMRNQIKKYGPSNVFVLTARMQEAAEPIHKWLKSKGINIPLENITGLGKSEGDAKAQWFLEKYAEGYNDMYFVDDALPNVEAVKHVFDQLDVKGKSVQARIKFSKSLDESFNNVLEDVKGIKAEKRYSQSKAKKRGAEKGSFRFFIPPSHEDFAGLLYNFMGSGRKGNEHRDFFEKSLITPLNRAYRELNAAKQAIANDYNSLMKQYPGMRNLLTKKTPDKDYFISDAVRVYLWDKSGFDIPGMSKTDQNELVKFVKQDKDLLSFANSIGVISKDEEGYVKPSDSWEAGDIRTDLADATGRVGRAKFFNEFNENADIIFSSDNLNKIEAAYGSNFREALEDMLYRVKNGTNRPSGNNRLVNRFLDYINGSVGATMFFNARSAVLQQLSMVNFINFGDNNIFKAANAFSNQKQFWSDYAMIFNSDFLKQRRTGKSFDVNANEIATTISKSKQPVRAAIKYLLNIGFLPTQIADSNAIALGGATFYRNRVNSYVKQGFSKLEAESKAFIDFQELAEATQQSARPDMISQQQASPLGRLILAFQNTPSQYARLIKKAGSDLINRRKVKGYDTQWQSDMSNISRIIYYGAAQNIIFYGLQTALFAMMFGDDEKDEEFFEKKQDRIINGTFDSILRGSGVAGAVISTVKNAAIKIHQESKKKAWQREDNALMMELLQLSPPIGIKARKLQQAEKTLKYNAKEIEKASLFDIQNPIYESAALTTEALTNIPVNRLHTKARNLRDATNNEYEWWKRVAMGLGWSKWNLGETEKEIKKDKEKIQQKPAKNKNSLPVLLR